MNNINFDIDDYTNNELLNIAEISEDASSEIIDQKFTQLIKQYLNSKDYKLAQFFHDAKEKVLDNLLKKEQTDNDDNQDENIQAEEWLKNQYRNPINTDQEDKITDRRHNTTIFDGNIRQVMSQKRLGISNNYPLNLSQDSLNPTLRQTVKHYININSTQRNNSVPFINNLNSKNSSSNFTINLNNPIKNVVSMRVESYNIPNTIYTFDPFYGNNVMMILTSQKQINDIDWEDFKDISSCTRVNLTPGSYKRPIDFINQLNLDIKKCQSSSEFPLLGIGKSLSSTCAWDPHNPCNSADSSGCFMSLQAHLADPLSLSPRVVFINTNMTYNIKIVFYKQIGIGDTHTPFDNYRDCSRCHPAAKNLCADPSNYKNNIGYFAGYRIERRINDNGEILFLNTNKRGSELSIILEKVSSEHYYTKLSKINELLPTLDGSITSIFDNSTGSIQPPVWFPKILPPCGTSAVPAFPVYKNPLIIGGYTIHQYAIDIQDLLIPIDTDTSCNYFNIANVPINLVASEYLYICINDFNQNRPPDNIITVAQQEIEIYPLPSYRPTRWPTVDDLSGQILDISADIICYKDKTLNLNREIYVPSWPKKLTQAQLYSLNEITTNNKKQKDAFNSNSNITDVMVTIPFKNDVNVLTSTENLRIRDYFGPVKIDRLEISLKDSRGNLVNLNGQDWAFSLVLEQLYQY